MEQPPAQNRQGVEQEQPLPLRFERLGPGDESSEEEDMGVNLNALQLINKKKEKKLRKDLLTSVTSPLALGVKLIITRNPAIAGMLKQAIMLRAKNPKKATFNSILRDEDALNWDYPLFFNSILAIYQTEILNAASAGKAARVAKLNSDLFEILKALIKDSLPIKVSAAKGVWEALLQDHPTLTETRDVFEAQRQTSLHIADNVAKCINYQMDVCHEYNFTKCDNKCKKLHACLLSHEQIEHHPARYCPNNTAKTKKTTTTTRRSTTWRMRGGFGYRNSRVSGRSWYGAQDGFYFDDRHDREYQRGPDRGYEVDRGYDRNGPNNRRNNNTSRRGNRERFNRR